MSHALDTSKEDPPVDPLLLEAREIYKMGCFPLSWAEQVVEKGEADRTDSMKAIITALKRGMEIEREKQS